MKAIGLLVLLVFACGCAAPSSGSSAKPGAAPWSVRMSDSVIARNPDPLTIEGARRERPNWSYSTAFLVHAVAQAGAAKDRPAYLDYGRTYIDAFLDASGNITAPTYGPDEQTLDDVEPGRLILMLLKRSDDASTTARYRAAVDHLAGQLKKQPRTSDGGFWHKKIYPHQMWLDGIFMACPFMVEYGKLANEPAWSDEAAKQILLIAKHTRDEKTGLYYHGWDESRSMAWADKQTGLSQCVWGRAVGWYMMGIVETLEELPKGHPRRAELISLFDGLADAVTKVQDPKTGAWYQVLDQGSRQGNYLESSASCMIVYSTAKAVRLGVADNRHTAMVKKGWEGILAQFVETDPATGHISLTDTCQVAGLGGRGNRSGTFEYYMSEKRVSNDPKGVAPFILAALEMERR